eukprot:3682829-Rhodomonas_salina.1
MTHDQEQHTHDTRPGAAAATLPQQKQATASAERAAQELFPRAAYHDVDLALKRACCLMPGTSRQARSVPLGTDPYPTSHTAILGHTLAQYR